MREIISNIFTDVNIIPKCGLPGTLVVFEQNAYPILTGDTADSILFAAAEYGQGRVFVTSHEMYIENFLKNMKFKKLWRNIKKWLTKGEEINDDKTEIRNIDEFELVSEIPNNVKILIWNGVCNKSELFINQLLKKYISNGGNLICGICPWGWLSISHGKTLDEMSLNKFIALCGICFSNDLAQAKSNYIDVKHNKAEQAHLGEAINKLSLDMSECINLENLINNGISCLPSQIAFKHLDRLHKILYSYICLNFKPTSKTSVTSPIGRCLLNICSKLYQKYSTCGLRIKAPNIEEFPGTYPTTYSPDFKNPIVTIKSKFDEFHCTGYYIMPGTAVQITVLDGNPTGWEVRISSHTDDLTHMDYLLRWPQVNSLIKLKKNLIVTSAFGGLIYFDSPKGNSFIKLKLENVLESPFYDLNKPETILNWSTSRNAPGLWAELCGKHVVFTVPSESIRQLNDPSDVLKLWDLIVIANHELRGTNVESTWRERIVVDVQPYGGFMHSGYPITIPYDYVRPESKSYLFDPQTVKTGCWNVIHELGHNMQRSSWTPSGSEEVTVNIFTLHVYNLVFNEPPWNNKFLKERLNDDHLKALAKLEFDHSEWRLRPYVGILVFTQLINSFGWDAFKIFFSEYEGLTDSEKIFKNDIDKWNEWIYRFSNIVGLDISPLFYFWGIPFSENLGTNLSDLIPWVPDDNITNTFKDRLELVKKKYSGLMIGNEEHLSTCTKIFYPENFRFTSINQLRN